MSLNKEILGSEQFVLQLPQEDVCFNPAPPDPLSDTRKSRSESFLRRRRYSGPLAALACSSVLLPASAMAGNVPSNASEIPKISFDLSDQIYPAHRLVNSHDTVVVLQSKIGTVSEMGQRMLTAEALKYNEPASESQLLSVAVCTEDEKGRPVPRIFKSSPVMRDYCKQAAVFMPFYERCKNKQVKACRVVLNKTKSWAQRAERASGRVWDVIEPIIDRIRNKAAEVISPN